MPGAQLRTIVLTALLISYGTVDIARFSVLKLVLNVMILNVSLVLKGPSCCSTSVCRVILDVLAVLTNGDAPSVLTVITLLELAARLAP